MVYTFSPNSIGFSNDSSTTMDNVDHSDKDSIVNTSELYCSIPSNYDLLSQVRGVCQTNEMTIGMLNTKLPEDKNYISKQTPPTKFRFSRLLGLGTTICNILLMKLQRRSYLLLIFILSVSMSLMTIFV